MKDLEKGNQITAADCIGLLATAVGAFCVGLLIASLVGCEVRSEPRPLSHHRHVHVDIDVNRPVCPPGRPCPYRRAGCPCQQGLPCQCGPRCECRFDLRLRKAIDLPGTSQVSTEGPAVNLPLESRQRNYNGGSCVCASTISVLRWQGREDLADRLREICSGGQSGPSIVAKMDRLGVEYAYTDRGDVDFLDWCCRTKRGATIFWKPNHSCTLVDLDGENAVVLDNNHVGTYEYTPRDRFIRAWQGYGGFALTPLVGNPAPPIPFVAQAFHSPIPR